MKKHFAFTMADRLSRPTESGAIHLNPSDWTTKNLNMTVSQQTQLRNRLDRRCHSELADLHSAEANNPVNCLPRGDEIRIASRLSEQEQSSLSETLRAWSKSKTDPESYKRWTLTSNAGKTLNQVQGDKMENIRALARIKALLPSLARLAGNVPTRYRAPHSARSRYSPIALLPSRAAFTMAEILLSLTIIGVVAAITLPSLTGNINERTWNTQRKALYARMSQAISLMPALNGYGTLTEDASGNVITDTAAEIFVTDGLAKVLKINNICDSEHLADCGIISSYANMSGSKNSMPTTLYDLNGWFSQAKFHSNSYSTDNTKAAAFETANGESIIAYYNRACSTDYKTAFLTSWGNIVGYFEANMCINFIYDLNGTKGPNTVGKDIGFITVFNSTDSSVVAPLPSSNKNASEYKVTYSQAVSLCKHQDNESRIPDINELASMAINKSMLNLINTNYWSGSTYDATKAWNIDLSWGGKNALAREMADNKGFVRCIKR